MSPSEDSDVAASSHADGALRFRTVRVDEFHDLRHGLDVDLCDDLTVVYGSNASGKTTLARAIRTLLWPNSVDDQRPRVEGQFLLDGDQWRIEVEGQGWTCLNNRQPASRPPLPPVSHGPRYHLSLHDLLRGAPGDQDFARLVLREAQGGIDVAGAAKALDFKVPTRRASKLSRAVDEARSSLRAARQEQKALREEEKRLDALRDKRAAAQAQAERASALEQALDVAQARAAHEEATERLDAFPEVLDEVRGDEGERLETLQAQIAEAERTLDEAEATLEEAEATIEESRIPSEGLPEGRLETLRTTAETLKDQERAVRDARAELEAASEAEAAAWDKLAAGVDRATVAEIDLPQVEVVEAHVQAVEEVRGRQSALETAEGLFAVDPPDASVETLWTGVRHLHRWLQAQAPESADESDRWRIVLVVTGGLVTAGGLGVAAFGAGLVSALGLALALGGLLVVAAEVLRGGGEASSGESQRSLHRTEFERLGVEPPDEWRPEPVAQHADHLLERLRTAAVAAQKRDAWDRLRPEREEVAERAAELRAERERLADQIGLRPDVSSRSLSWLLDRLGQWQSAYEAKLKAEAALEAATSEAAACRERISDRLAPYDLGPVEDAGEAKGAVEALQSAWETVREAQRRRDRAEETTASAEADREEALAERQALFARLNLEDGAEAELRALVDQHEEYRSAVEAERTARTTLETTLEQLRRADGFEEWMATATEADLAQELEAAEAEAARADEYFEEIKDIEHAIEAARSGGTVEERQATYRQKRDQLAQEREADYDRAVGAALAELVQEETRDRGLPPVFHRAQDLFADITNHRYELQLNRKEATFRAYDHTHDRSFPLDALSSGTQVQLLLAVRVAFVETQEQGPKPPLVLDETLANSDAERARAIIDAVCTICRKGRQVLYLTAQADEVEKWASALAQDDTLDHDVVTLSDVNDRPLVTPGDGTPVPSRPTPADLPAPEATTHEALRETLDVPRWTPREPVKQLHLWYLVEAPAPLLDLVEAGTRTWGQLQFQHQRGGRAATGLAADRIERVEALARSVRSWKEAWQVGRGRPVDRPALEQTDAVTGTFIDGVSELAEELDGDAEALLRVVRERSDERVRGFRTAKADDLETYLHENEYLDPRDRLTPAEMWQYVLADLSTARREGIVTLGALERLFARLDGDTPEQSR